jgi:hypothetical protein
VKDFRTDTALATIDVKGRASCSPVKGQNSNGKHLFDNDDEYWIEKDDFSEEAIEIDCGVVDTQQ